MTDKQKEYVEALVKKAVDAASAAEAVHYSRAALDAASALRVLTEPTF